MQRSVEFEALGRRWSLRYDVKALCEIEAQTGMSINKAGRLLADAENLKVTDLVMFFGAGVAAVSGVAPAREEVMSIMTELGMARAGQLIGEAFALAFPQPKTGAGEAGAEGAGKQTATAA